MTSQPKALSRLSSTVASDSHDPAHAALIALAEQIAPLMQGSCGGEQPLLRAVSATDEKKQDTSGALLSQLYGYWQQQHPEAGPLYWLTRSWTMLSWQPIYLSLLSVYGIQAVPELRALSQTLHLEQGLVAGFSIANTPVYRGEQAMLIRNAANELWQLLSQLQQQFDQQIRLRPGLIKSLLADDLVASALRMQHLRDDLSHSELMDQIACWQHELKLPATPPTAFFVDQATQMLAFTRKSCCMHYRRNDGDYCANCPKANKVSRCLPT
ncbi:siderophore ferric iron reductase [Motilimonas cestriensis]|uniref:siderophore ferric iron reductase n=1 Tax=Motilimonas cestriensis TaxID=2742685 RepID=UPI003DA4DA46